MNIKKILFVFAFINFQLNAVSLKDRFSKILSNNFAVVNNISDTNISANTDFSYAYDDLKNCDLKKAKTYLNKIENLSEKQKNKLIKQINLMEKDKSYFDSDLRASFRSYVAIIPSAIMLHKMLKYNVGCEEAKRDSYIRGQGGLSHSRFADIKKWIATKHKDPENINVPAISSTWVEFIITLNTAQILALLASYSVVYKILETIDHNYSYSRNIKELQEIKDIVLKINTEQI